jgi:hypothetical protein
MRSASPPRPTTLPAHPGPDRTKTTMRMLLRLIPAATSTGTHPGVTTCNHARCPNDRKPGPRPMSTRSCVRRPRGTPGSDSLPDTACPVVSRPDTVPSTGHASRTGSDADRGTDERHGRQSDILDRHDHRRPAGTRRAPCRGAGVCGLANQGWLGNGNTASATVTTAATRQPLGVALPSKPRLGALLSSPLLSSPLL